MTNHVLTVLREFMTEQKVDYLLVNSTNKFLVEYNTLSENSRYHLTNFTGSTGDALVTPDKVLLFVDGRYHIQADLEVDPNITTVVKLQTGQTFLEEMLKNIPPDAVLGLFSEKNPPDRKTRADLSIRCGAILPFLFRNPSFKLAVGNIAAEKSAFILNQPGE